MGLAIAEGTVLLFLHGEWDTTAPYKVLKTFDKQLVSYAYRMHHEQVKISDTRYSSTDAFITWMEANGYIVELDGVEYWSLGEYSFDPELSGN